MPKASVLLLGIASLLVAGASQAELVKFDGKISLLVLDLQPVEFPSSGGSITINGSGGFGHLTRLDLPSGAFLADGVLLPITDPGGAPIKGIQLTAMNSAAVFEGQGGAGFGGVMGIQGVAKVCLFGACDAAIANLVVPLDVVGNAGTQYATAAVNLTVKGAPWTTVTTAIGTATAMGAVTPASATGAPGGSVRLVTPIFVSTNIGPSAVVPIFGLLDIQIPEPGQLSLMLASIAALFAFGAIRTRRRERRGA